MSEILTTNKPNEAGEMLWCVEQCYSYYDNDPRMPGTVTTCKAYYVLAKSDQEAINKVDLVRRDWPVSASVVTLEDLVPAIERQSDGLYSQKFSKVALHDAGDKRYRLGVCLIPC